MPYVHIFSILSNFVETTVSHGGYFLIFIFTVIEGIPLVGMVVPGHIAIVVSGFLAKLGTFSLLKVIIVAIIGALIGDYIGFSIGRKYGMNFISRLRPYFFITDSHIEKTQALLAKHTGKALIIGRFTPATRALMPFIVGTTATSSSKFWLFNVVGGIAWVVSSVLTGYIFGAAYHATSKYIGRALIIAILATMIFIWGYKFVNSRFHIFKKYELFTLVLNVLSLLTFAIIVDKLVDSSFKLGFDVWISAFMDKFAQAHSFIVELARIISDLGNVYVMTGLGLILGITFAVKRKWRSSVIMITSIVSTVLVSGMLKIFFMSPRPHNSLGIILHDPSFPSTHSSMAAAFFVILAYLLAPKINSWVKREIMLASCILITIIIGLSRLILNVHWFSDVVAGWSVGIFFATASILLVRYVGTFVSKKVN